MYLAESCMLKPPCPSGDALRAPALLQRQTMSL